MLHKNLQAIILAAGKSTRFGTGSSKLLAPLCGQAMVVYPARLFHELGIEITVVTGHQKEDIESTFNAHIKSGINMYIKWNNEALATHSFAPNIRGIKNIFLL